MVGTNNTFKDFDCAKDVQAFPWLESFILPMAGCCTDKPDEKVDLSMSPSYQQQHSRKHSSSDASSYFTFVDMA
jgi:hypothetical protein